MLKSHEFLHCYSDLLLWAQQWKRSCLPLPGAGVLAQHSPPLSSSFRDVLMTKKNKKTKKLCSSAWQGGPSPLPRGTFPPPGSARSQRRRLPGQHWPAPPRGHKGSVPLPSAGGRAAGGAGGDARSPPQAASVLGSDSSSLKEASPLRGSGARSNIVVAPAGLSGSEANNLGSH